MTDEEIGGLILRVGRGDREAFRQLYAATAPRLFGLCLRVLRGDRLLAEEALQEAFVRIWQKAGRYAPAGAAPMGWLVTLTRNVALDRLRAERSAGSPASPDGTLAALEAPDPGPERVATARDQLRRLTECLGELPPERAEAIRRAYLEGMTYAELAAHFDVPLNTMRSWLRRGLIALKECLDR